MQRRKDNKGRVLRDGESYRKSDGLYMYRWTDKIGKRHTKYAKTLDELRKIEEEIQHDIRDGIKIGEDNIVYYNMKDGTSIPVAVSLLNTPLKKDTDLTMSDPCYGVVVTATNHDNAVAFIKYAFGL